MPGALTAPWRLARHAGLALALVAGAARADFETRWTPRVWMGGGYNDNIKIDGSGGDAFGQVMPGLRLDIAGEHELRMRFDCDVALARLAEPQRFGAPTVATSEACGTDGRVHLSARDGAHWTLRTTYAQDPFAVSNLGLLLRPGQDTVFSIRGGLTWTHALSLRSKLEAGFDANSLRFAANDPGNNLLATPRIGWSYQTDARTTLGVDARDQVFVSMAGAPNLLGTAPALLGRVSRKLTGWADVTLRAGGELLDVNGKQSTLPVGRLEVNAALPRGAVYLVLAHDLVIGPSNAGALQGDLAEAAMVGHWGRLSPHLRAGLYRNAVPGSTGLGSVGYGTEVGLSWAFVDKWAIGAAALRDARLADPAGNDDRVNRNVVRAWIGWQAE